MTNEQEYRITIKNYSRIAFDPNIVDTKKKVYVGIVVDAIASLYSETRKTSFDIEEICSILKKKFSLPTIPSLLVREALLELSYKNIVKEEHRRWSLLNYESLVKSLENNEESMITAINETIRLTIGRKLDSEEVSVLSACVEAILAEVGKIIENDIDSIIFQKDRPLEFFLDVPQAVTEVIEKYSSAYLEHPSKLQEYITQGIVETFQKAPDLFSKAMGKIASAIVMVRLITQDPELSKLNKKTFKDCIIVIDTNVLFSLVCKGSKLHDVATMLMDVAKDLGIKIYVQDITLDEFEKILTKDTVRYYSQKGNYIDPKFSLRDIPRTFYKYKDEYGDWQGLISTLKQSFPLLKEKYNLEIYPSKDTTHDEKELEKICRYIEDSQTRIDVLKDVETLQHDAKSILVIQDLRRKMGKVDVINAPWFLTRDVGVVKASYKFSKEMGASTPTALDPNMCTYLLFPFIGVKINVDEMTKILGKMILSKIAPLDIDITTAFLRYSFEQMNIPESDDLIEHIVSDAHMNRCIQKHLLAGNLQPLFQDIKIFVEKALSSHATIEKKDEVITRLVTLIKETSKEKIDTGITKSSGIAKLCMDIQRKLRVNIPSETYPEEEKIIQDSLHRLLITLDYEVNRKESIQFSEKGAFPDFVVKMGSEKIPIEVKLVNRKAKIVPVIEEMSADLTQYKKSYPIPLFVVYDCGFIADVDNFSRDFENQGSMVLIVKH